MNDTFVFAALPMIHNDFFVLDNEWYHSLYKYYQDDAKNSVYRVSRFLN